MTILIFSQIWKFQVNKEAHRIGSELVSSQNELILIKKNIDSANSFLTKRKELYFKETSDSLTSNTDFVNQLLADKNRLEKERAELEKNYNQKITEINKTYEDSISWESMTNWSWIFKTMNISGTILFISGLLFWYFKHQRYIDAEKKLEGEKFLKKLKKKSKEGRK